MDNETLKEFIKVQDYETVADKLFVEPVLAHSKIANPIDFRADFKKQFAKIVQEWNKTVHKISEILCEIESFEDQGEYSGVESDNETVITYLYTEGHFNSDLTAEEVNILATYMIVEWLGQQLASVENTRLKYSGSDFKFTSQANHMSKLLNLKNDYEREGFHLQRLYKRRLKDENGIMRSTFGSIMEVSTRDFIK